MTTLVSRKEEARMMRQWLKILVLTLALLSQVAMSCQGGGQSGGSSAPDSSAPRSGGY